MEQVIAFERFLGLSATDAIIEYEADHHRFSGSPEAYQAAVEKVSLSYFNYPGVNVAELMRIRSMKYTYSKNLEFKARVRSIFADGEMIREITTTIPLEASPDLAEVIADIESTHLGELPDEDIAQYSMRDMPGRIAMWENLLFKNDPLYQRLKATKARENVGE